MIRKATPNDVAKLVGLAEAMLEESNFSGLSFDREKAELYFQGLIKGNQFLIVSELDGEIVGGMAGYLHTPFYSNDSVAYEDGIFVASNHRHGVLAYKMLSLFTTWAKCAGTSQIRPNVSTGKCGESADRLYEKLGYTRTGSTFLLSLVE